MVDEGDLPFPVEGIPYHGITAVMRAHGYAPTCPYCHQEMFPADDHGRFMCFCNGLTTVDGVTGMQLRPAQIPQVDTKGMDDLDKAKIPPINRLDAPPTAAEQALLAAMTGPDIDSDECKKAEEALRAERGKG